jgi:hypothetical protein
MYEYMRIDERVLDDSIPLEDKINKAARLGWVLKYVGDAGQRYCLMEREWVESVVEIAPTKVLKKGKL